MAVTDVRVAIAFDSAPDDPMQVWTDVTDRVRLADGINITRGRSDEQGSIEPGRLSLTLDNTGGPFTWGYAGSPHYPNVLPRKRIRVRVYEGDGWWSNRFDGYIDGWPASFAGVLEQPQVRITATDRLARLGWARQLRDALHEEWGSASYSTDGWVLDDPGWSILDETTTLAGGLQWLYGLQESSGSTTAGDVSGALGRANLASAQVGTGGTLEFGASGIMPEGTACQFSPESAGNGVVLTGSASGYVGTEFTLACQFAWTGATGAQLVQLGTSPAGRVTISVTPTTVVTTFTAPSGSSATATKTVATGDNRPHLALVSVSGTTINLHVDALSAATGSVPTGMGTAQGLTIGGTSSADVHQVAWVAFSNTSTDAFRAADLGGVGSAAAELSGARIQRILGWLRIPTADRFFVQSGQSQVAYQAAGDAEALDLINEVCRVESGRFFASGDGTFTFFDRSFTGFAWSYSTSVANVDPSEYAMVVDTSGLVNDLTVSRPAGATFRMRDEASIEAYGEFSASDTYYASDDDTLRDLAAVRLNRYANPVARVPSIKVDLLTEASQFVRQIALSTTDLGTRITLTGLPAATTPGGVTSLELVVEGIREDISATTHTLAFTTSPSSGLTWLLDDADRSILDSTTILSY